MNVGVKSKEYNYGIEVLRIVSMIMVVVLHVLGQGGILNNAPFVSPQYHVAWALECLSYCAVNCYALISGYVMVDSTFKYRKIVMLWLQAAFYSVGITLLFLVMGMGNIDTYTLVCSFFPILTKRWWYLTAYAGMFFLIPFMNILLKNLNKKELIMLNISVIGVFSCVGTLMSKLMGDIFNLEFGYSVWWLCILYLIGASLKIFKDRLKGKKKQIFLGWCICNVITILVHNISVYLPEGFPGGALIPEMLVNYISPTIVGSAICLVILFSDLKIEKMKIRKGIKFISGLTFGVYLIHVDPRIWSLIEGRFATYGLLPVVEMVSMICVSVFAIFIGCMLIEAVRSWLFKVLKVKESVNRVIDCIQQKLSI